MSPIKRHSYDPYTPYGQFKSPSILDRFASTIANNDEEKSNEERKAICNQEDFKKTNSNKTRQQPRSKNIRVKTKQKPKQKVSAAKFIQLPISNEIPIESIPHN
jgi:hypothetical protein